jgi:hypothetical protein
MDNTNIPTDRELPSTAKLVKSTIFAASTAFILLVGVVMPAEYGIDPTGLGKVTGLQKMGEIKMSLAQEAKSEKMSAGQETQPIAPVQETKLTAAMPAEVAGPANGVRRDEMKVTLAPNEGTEIKVTLEKGKSVNYVWWTNGGKANFDVHGDSKQLDIDYHGYGKGSEQRKEGVIVAAFNGDHGWFWRNRTPETITVTLQTSGEYTDIKHMK